LEFILPNAFGSNQMGCVKSRVTPVVGGRVEIGRVKEFVMKSLTKKLIVAAILVTFAAGVAFAYGGGGVFHGTQLPIAGYSNVETAADLHGGYGYGASRDGSRYGGFGVSLKDQETDEFLGAFGGVITGRQFRTGPFTLSANIWSGIGYASPELVPAPAGFAFFAELNAEAGFSVLPWLQISVYGGYQAIGSIDPAAMFANTRYTPVAGARVTWGGF
jgi:hypothetical protein